MIDLTEAVRRFKRAETEGTHTAYDGDYDSADFDAYALAREDVKFAEPTPLADLTDEQWEELGFERRYGLFCNFWQWSSAESDWLHWCRDHGLVINAKEARNVQTLVQLRALMFAIGGE